MRKIFLFAVTVLLFQFSFAQRKLDGTSYVMVDDIGSIFKTVKLPGHGDSVFSLKIIGVDSIIAFRFIASSITDAAASIHTHAYNTLTGIPSTFSPSAHLHPQSEVTNLVNDLAGKAAASHVHAFSSLTATPTTLLGYGITDAAALSHTHTFASNTSKPTTIAGYGITDAFTQTAADLLYSALSHTHTFASNTSKPTTLSGYGITDAAAASHVHAFASLTSTPTTLLGYGITDAAALSHTHTFASNTSKPTTLSGYGITDAFTQTAADLLYAAISHTHTFASATSKPTTLSGYGITDAAAASHVHAFASLTSTPTTLLGYGITDAAALSHTHAYSSLTSIPSTFAPSAHSHAESEVTNLVTDLAAKQSTLVNQTNLKSVNGATLLGSGDLGISGAAQTFVNLTSAFSSTIVTEVTVTGWSFAVTAGKTYRVEVIADYQTAAITTGGELGFFLSASAVGTIRGYADADIVNTAAATGLKQPITICTTADAAGSNLISTGVTAINSPHSFHALVTFTCTTSGTFNVGWASEVAASAAQINANSSLIYQQLN